jgi:hypothetical protein
LGRDPACIGIVPWRSIYIFDRTVAKDGRLPRFFEGKQLTAGFDGLADILAPHLLEDE